jgi:hypothetical protein
MKRLIAMIVLLTASTGAFACPLCKDSVPNAEGDSGPMKTNYTSNGENISGGINQSIYLFFAGLFGTLGMIGTVVFRSMRHTPMAPLPSRGGFPVRTREASEQSETSDTSDKSDR